MNSFNTHGINIKVAHLRIRVVRIVLDDERMRPVAQVADHIQRLVPRWRFGISVQRERDTVEGHSVLVYERPSVPETPRSTMRQRTVIWTLGTVDWTAYKLGAGIL